MNKFKCILVYVLLTIFISGCKKEILPVVDIGVVLNEIMPVNISVAADQDNEYDDWIEIYNKNSTSIDISGFFLTDSEKNLRKWEFPSGSIILADSFIVVWADSDSLQSGLHANFGLSSLGETVIFLTSELELIDQVTYNEVPQNEQPSYARLPNGSGEFVWLQSPTFNSRNARTEVNNTDLGVVINEIMPVNISFVTDQNKEHDDWIEIYNKNQTPIDISGFYLTDSEKNLRKWKFPTGTVVLADSFIVVWADSDTLQEGLHANFELSSLGETVMFLTSELQVINRVTYSEVLPNEQPSYARLPNGTGEFVWLQSPTFNSRNALIEMTNYELVINEVMPFNSNLVMDPLTGEFDDWIELFNLSDEDLNLSGFYLTDSKTNLKKWKFPEGTVILRDSFLCVWADGDTLQTGLHTNFKLSTTGETLLLLSPDLLLLDRVSYDPQLLQLSFARVPDGTGDLSWGAPTFNNRNIRK